MTPPAVTVPTSLVLVTDRSATGTEMTVVAVAVLLAGDGSVKPGVIPVTATVIAGANTDRLAGEFDLHEEAHDDAASEHPWQPAAAWLVGAMLAIVLLVWSVRRVRIAPSARSGGAA